MELGSANSFEIGQILVGRVDDKAAAAIVLDKAEDTGALLLMTLSEGKGFEVSADEAKSWSVTAPPQARWMEVSEGEGEPPFFAAYLPSLNDAIAAARVFHDRGDFRVEIFAASNEEQTSIAGS